MRKLTIEVEAGLADWIERRRGAASPEAFAARAVAAYREIDEHGTALPMARLQGEMMARLDELQRRIQRLDGDLRERLAAEVPGFRR